MENSNIGIQGLNPMIGGCIGNVNNSSNNIGNNSSNGNNGGVGGGVTCLNASSASLGFQNGLPLVAGGGLLGQNGGISIQGPHSQMNAVTAANQFLAQQIAMGGGSHPSFPFMYGNFPNNGSQQGQKIELGEEDGTKPSNSLKAAAAQMILHEINKNRNQLHPNATATITGGDGRGGNVGITEPALSQVQLNGQFQILGSNEDLSTSAQTVSPQPTLALTPLGLIPILPKVVGSHQFQGLNPSVPSLPQNQSNKQQISQEQLLQVQRQIQNLQNTNNSYALNSNPPNNAANFLDISQLPQSTETTDSKSQLCVALEEHEPKAERR
ncbi:hypothetical protein ChTU502y2012_393g0045 [Cryptosporidium hominis]|nr:hypothetical protein ChTU502y2012_393g0045 [Cryptosporidium hominis]